MGYVDANVNSKGGDLNASTGGPTITYPPPPPGFVNPQNPGLQVGTFKVSNSGLIVGSVAVVLVVVAIYFFKRR